MSTHTVRLHRVIAAPPSRVYRAFTDPDAWARWLPPDGFTGHTHALDARVGGAWRMSFTNFSSGHSHAFGGRYVELVPERLIRYDCAFDDPNLPGTMQTTITLAAVPCGTDFTAVQEGIPGVIPVDGCYLGWQQSLANLVRLVEPGIPG